MVAPCKPDLIMGVLRQLGYDTPDPRRLTEAVHEVSAQIRNDHGLDTADCLVLVPVNSAWYQGSLRQEVSPPSKNLGV